MPKKRLLSEFMAREMLMDYVEDKLSGEMLESFEEALKEFQNLKDEIRQLKGAIEYCKAAKGAELAESIFLEIEREENLFKHVYKSYLSAPLLIRYGVPSVAALVLSLSVLKFFWTDIKIRGAPSFVTLYKIAKMGDKAGQEIVSKEQSQNTSDPLESAANLSDENTNESPKEVMHGPPLPTPAAIEVAKIEKIKASLTKAELSKEDAKVIAANSEIEKQDRPSSSAPGEAGSRKGFVYRAYMFSNQISIVTPAIIEKIKTIGGDRAGEVDLGWKRKGGRYFHFWIPENKYEDFLNYIRAQGPVRIQKDAHQRVMPIGQIRFILWVEDTVEGVKSTHENSIQEPESKSQEGKEVSP